MNLGWHCARSQRSLEPIKDMSTVFNNLKDVKEAPSTNVRKKFIRQSC